MSFIELLNIYKQSKNIFLQGKIEINFTTDLFRKKKTYLNKKDKENLQTDYNYTYLISYEIFKKKC